MRGVTPIQWHMLTCPYDEVFYEDWAHVIIEGLFARGLLVEVPVDPAVDGECGRAFDVTSLARALISLGRDAVVVES